MEDIDKTMAPRRGPSEFPADDVTMPGKRDRKPDGRFAVGDLIMNRYKVLAELGQGGMGVVYKCFDETAGIEVALKALPPELSHNTLEMEDIKDNFQLVAKLVHQNIAISKNLEKDESNGNYYLIMECCEGEDLRRWIRRKRKDGELTLEAVLPIIRQVADALDYAHKQMVIHRDIKPGNIMIAPNGDIKVLDFGLAAQIHTSMTRVSMAYYGTSGTGPYMAPEQWRGRAQGASADQYALAVMTYEMLAGHLPFESTDPAVLQQAVLTQDPENIAGIPDNTQNALKRAMSKEPAERFESCSDFAAALGGKKIKSAKKQSNGGFPKWAAAVIILALLGAGVVGYYFSRVQSSVPELPSTPVVPGKIAEMIAEAQAAKKQSQWQNVLDLTARILQLDAENAEAEKLHNEAKLQIAASDPAARLSEQQLDSENAALKIELNGKIKEINQKNYDPAQGFGQKIKEMNLAFAIAEGAKLLITANKKYKEAKKLADWILQNGELREAAKRFKLQAQSNRSAAEKYDPATYAPSFYTDAENFYKVAERFYNEIKFAEAKKSFEEAAKSFEKAKNTAFDTKLQFLTGEAKKAEKAAKWSELKIYAGKIRPLNNSLANQFEAKADNELKAVAVEKELVSARKAKTESNWQKVYDHAKAALKIDGSHAEGQALEREAKIIIGIKNAQKELAAEQWEKALNLAEQVLEISPNNTEAREIRTKAQDNMVTDDVSLKNHLLNLCRKIKNPDYYQKIARKRLNDFKFQDFRETEYNKYGLTTLLGDAILVGASFSAVKYLIEQKNMSVEYIGQYTYRTPLCNAVEQDNIQLAKYLISKGASLNPSYKVKYGVPPLFFAKNLTMAKFLVEAGADVMWKNYKGRTLPDNAKFELAQFLIAQGARLTDPDDIYRKAASDGKIEYLKKHSGKKIVNVKDLMIYAAKSADLNLIKYLEKLGMSFTVVDEYQNTVLHNICSKKGTPEMFQYLWEKSGLSLEVRNKFERTPLMVAVECKNVKLVDYLIKKGADINAKDRNGNPLLFRAVYDDNIDVVRCLVENGADVNVKANGRTLVHWAYTNSNQRMISYLCKNGADLNLSSDTNSGWCTALADAVYNKNIPMINFLLKLGADPLKVDASGRTPLSLVNSDEVRKVMLNKVKEITGGQLIARNAEELRELIDTVPEGSEIRLKAGTYIFNDTVWIKKAMKIIGEDRDRTIIRTGKDWHIWESTNNKLVELKNMTFQFLDKGCLSMREKTTLEMQNCRVNSGYYYTISTSKKCNLRLKNCITGRLSIYYDNNLEISGGSISSTLDKAAISISDGSQALIKNTVIKGTYKYGALYVNKNCRTKVYDSQISNNNGPAINSFGVFYAENCVMTGTSNAVSAGHESAYFNSCQLKSHSDGVLYSGKVQQFNSTYQGNGKFFDNTGARTVYSKITFPRLRFE